MPAHTLRTSMASAAALLLLAAQPQAHAQSSYTMTVLSKPSNTDAVHYIPHQLDDLGVVRGVSYYKVGLTLAPGYRLLTTYSPQAASWASGTGASITPILGSKKFLPVFSNKQSLIVGQIPTNTTTLTGLLPLFDSAQFAPYLGPGVIRQGGVDTPFPAGSKLTPTALNNAGLIIGTNATTATPGPAPGPTLPFQLLNGALSVLELGGFDYVTPQAVNEAGVIVGTALKVVVTPATATAAQTETSTSHPVMWVNGRLSELNVPASMAPFVSAYMINNAGQVLISSPNGGPAIWFNGVTTPLKLQPHNDSSYNRLAAFNDAGTIAGCEISGTTTWPFLWKNGTQIDLAQDLAAKGIKPPTGYSWGCPTALNNAGSMIMYYWKPSSDSVQPNSSVAWVRLNAKP
jgi:uncharacterized membrane protein